MEKDRFIPMAVPVLGEVELRNATHAVHTGWISSQGEFVGELERRFAEKLGVAHGIAVSSGTAAMHLTLAAGRVGVGDEVLVPAITYISSFNAVTCQGASPMVVDCHPESWRIDPERFEEATWKRVGIG